MSCVKALRSFLRGGSVESGRSPASSGGGSMVRLLRLSIMKCMLQVRSASLAFEVALYWNSGLGSVTTAAAQVIALLKLT